MTDVQQLFQVFGATYHHEPQVRGQAEAQLDQLRNVPGSLSLVLQLIASGEIDTSVRQAASIFFKNCVRRGWKTTDTNTHVPISEQDKSTIKQEVLNAIVHTPPSISTQIIACLPIILDAEYPDHWPEFLPTLQNMLQTNDQRMIHGALSALREAVKIYQWRSKNRRRPLYSIIDATFSLLIPIGNQLLGYDNPESGEMMKLLCKIYFSSCLSELSKTQQDPASLLPWMTLFLQVVSKPIPIEPLPTSSEECEKHVWWKAKKWAMYCVNRLFSRYGNPALIAGASTGYKQFADRFICEIMPKVLPVYLGEANKTITEGAWMSQRCAALTCHLLSDSIKHKTTWAIIKPHIEILVSRFIFPLLCFTPEDEELWSTDAIDYINKKTGPLEEFRSPALAAKNLLLDLVRDRKKFTFASVLNFINTTLMSYQQTPIEARNPREKDGALCMVGCLSDQMLAKKSPVRARMEEFVMVHVYSEFTSSVPYLRARACETMSRFDKLEFANDQNLIRILEATLTCLKDPELPVRVQAAILLGTLINFEQLRSMIAQNLPNIMGEFLNLTNRLDVDSLTGVIDDVVEMFGEDLAPFAVQLCQQLCNTYLRIANEIVATENKQDMNNFETSDSEEAADKIMIATGILRNIATLIDSLDTDADLQEQLEVAVLPAITFTFQQSSVDLYDELLKVVDSCIDARETISSAMWGVLKSITDAFKSHAIEFTEVIFPTITRFVSSGKEVITANHDIRRTLAETISLAMTADQLGENDRICACTLMECLLLNCPGALDEYLSHFIDAASQYLFGEDIIKTGAFRIRCLATIISALLYNPAATLLHLEQRQKTSLFFQVWFENLNRFNGLHDAKLSVVAICMLLEKPDDQVPTSVSANWADLLKGLVGFLPKYIKAEEDYEQDRASIDSDDDQDDIEAIVGGEIEDDFQDLADRFEEGFDDDEDVENEDSKYLEFLASQAAACNEVDDDGDNEDGDFELHDSDEEGEEADGESMFTSPLDDLNVYTKLEETLKGLEIHRATVYSTVISSITAEQQSAITTMMETAANDRQS